MRMYLFSRHDAAWTEEQRNREGCKQFVYVTNQFISSPFPFSFRASPAPRGRVNFWPYQRGLSPFFREEKEKNFTPVDSRSKPLCHFFSLAVFWFLRFRSRISPILWDTMNAIIVPFQPLLKLTNRDRRLETLFLNKFRRCLG